MENPIINNNSNPHNLIDFTIINTSTHLITANGAISGDDDEGDDNIEMVDLHVTSSYTSLKDMLLDSPPLTGSPTGGGSWKEIPIKDPLLQHAAWAYLQPTGEARDEEKNWWRRLQERCCGLFGCFGEVVAVVLRRGGGDRKFD